METEVTKSGTGRVEVERTMAPEVQMEQAKVGNHTAQLSETRIINPFWLRARRLIWLIAGVVDIFLAFDFVFRALSAHDVGFASFIYSVGSWLGSPLDGIFGNTVNATTRGIIGIDRWGDIMAIAIYSLVAWAVVELVRIVTTPKDTISSSKSTTVV